MKNGQQQHFVSEPIKPVMGTVSPGAMAIGEPGLPRAFRWRDRELAIASVQRTWRETGPCRHGSSETYVRQHWYEVLTDHDEIVQIYFERHTRGRDRTKRWWLYSIDKKEDRTS